MKLETLLPTIPRVPGIRLRYLLRELGLDEKADLSHGHALFLWLANWLAVANPVPQGQQDLILTELGGVVVGFGDKIPELLSSSRSEVERCLVAVFDRTWVTVTGRPAFLHLYKREYVPAMPAAPAETILYDLMGLYVRNAAALARRGKGAAGGTPVAS